MDNAEYTRYKSSIIDDIQNSLSKIYITVDLWTSGSYKFILGVARHYIPMDGQLKHNILGVRELEGYHSGENQAKVVNAVIFRRPLRKTRNIVVCIQ